jgi:hypothetical protein
MSKNPLIDAMVDDFLRWPLPDSVCADGCATKQGPGRVGTNLLTAIEAKQMFEAVVLPKLTLTMPKPPAPEYVASLEKRIAKQEGEWRVENRTIAVLVAAGFVSQAKVDEARGIVGGLD